ncbi:S-adenosylmethionine decarboxylase proenzyme [Synechococcus phage B3]|jgi:S-adenosylmethionine decarboxylase|nr:S-adenosylmethionine decarboxylase proenzyme [Synechococcus phage B3]QGT54983.1 S-adenosylmethionine decarboxylase proenzyme [Synechococcus phage B23]
MGKHYLLDLYGCEFEVLDNLEFLLQLLVDSALLCGATILNKCYHKFEPQGVTIILLLAESHISIHTVPEKGEAYVDVYTCSIVDPEISCLKIIDEIKPSRHNLRLFDR